MSETALASSPTPGTVIREQLRTVGLAIRREVLGAAAFVVIPTLAVFIVVAVSGPGAMVLDGLPARLDLDPGEGWGVISALLAVLCPVAVWKGERLFGDTQLWTLPVDRRRHALIKVGAGWAWLMAFVLAALTWLAVLVVLSGGTLDPEETRLVIIDPVAAGAGQPGGTEAVRWSTPWWQWLLPFTGATAAYLLGSALLLATERPWRWVAGAVLAYFVVGVLGELSTFERAVEEATWAMIFGPLGLESLTTGGLEGLTTAVRLPSGDWTTGWSDLPSLKRWVGATALWTGLGAVGLWVALLRHRER